MAVIGAPSELVLRVGEQYELVLPGLATAGYRWEEVLDGSPDVVALAWRRGVPPGEATGRPIGASAPERLGVTASAPGQVVVHLAQRRPWEIGPPRAEHTVEVRVLES